VTRTTVERSLRVVRVNERRPPRWMRVSAAILLGVAGAAQTIPQNARTLLDRAVASFAAGRLAESVAEFDELARLVPDQAPYLWQRGIAQYYAGQFRECRAQFESHRTVNADDVENAAWHFLCVARAESVAAARAALLPVGPDRRVPMREIYRMFRGELSPEQVMAAAGARADGQFYAHLYVALYAEAAGERARTLEHLRSAAASRYAAAGGYMHMVARVHLARLEATR
jgi:tetratricopeptide (TPR) repeat protein